MTRHPLRPRLACERPPAPRPALAFRLLAEDNDTPSGPLARARPLALFEAALLLADEPLSARRLAALAGLEDASAARLLLARLRDLYDADGTAFQVEELAGGYQLLTRAEYHPWLARLRRAVEVQLSPAARETLTLVAYRQPVTRADIEEIRGVSSTGVLEQLLERGLIRQAGRDDSLGRPTLYETTKKFLQVYGLRSLRDLPPMEGLG
jgi:segregation and condensation protein B